MAGSVVQSIERVRNDDLGMWIVSLAWTGDASNGGVPNTALSDAIKNKISGSFLLQVKTIPGSPAPTTLYDITLEDGDGLDVMQGTLSDRSATLVETAVPKQDSKRGVQGPVYTKGDLTLKISNQGVNSAKGTIRLYFCSDTTVFSSGGLVGIDQTTGQNVVILGAGTALAGKVGIDQTTPGTTNGVVLNAGEAHVGAIGGNTVKINSALTRATGTATYAPGDSVSSSTSAPAVNTIAGASRINAGSGVVLNASLVDESNPTLAGEFEAWIYEATRTPDNDNAAFAPTPAQEKTLVAIVPFSSVKSYVGAAGSGAAGNRVYQADPINRGFV